MSIGFNNPRIVTPYAKLERNPTIYVNSAVEPDIQIASLSPLSAQPFPYNTQIIQNRPPDIPIRVVTPSHIIYDNSLVDIKPLRSPTPPPPPSPPPPPPIEKVPKETKVNWFFKKELAGLANILWLIIGISFALSIITITITITVYRCRQVNKDPEYTTWQSGRFVSEACTDSTQCLENGQCVSSTCQCAPDFYYNEESGQCLTKKTFGLSCIDSRDCNSFLHLVCISGVCSCPLSKVWANYYGSYDCVRTREIGQSCLSSSDCVKSSYCAYVSSSYKCACLSGYYPDVRTGQCELVKKVYEPCQTTKPSYGQCPTNSVCRGTLGDTNTFCYCVTGYYYDESSASCLAQSTYGGSCTTTNYQCLSFTNLICANYTCICKTTQYWNGASCTNYLLYSQQCTSSSQCNPWDTNMVCALPILGTSQKICRCNSGYFFDEYTGFCKAQIAANQNCSASYECINNAFCGVEPIYLSSKICQCSPGYFYSQNTNACLSMITYGYYGATCASGATVCNIYKDLYCLINTSAYKCSCKPDYFWNGSVCELSYAYGETCNPTFANSCRQSRNLNCDSAALKCTCSPSNPTYNLLTGACT